MATQDEEVNLIGLCDGEIDAKKYPSSYLTNKVGGSPDILPTITWQHPLCNRCNAVLIHVIQVYCPLEASPYHRNLHLFACTSSLCVNESDSWRVLRSQCLESEVKAAPVQQTPSCPPSNDAPMSATDWCTGADDWGMEDEEEGSTLNDKAPTQCLQVAAEAEMSTELDVSKKLKELRLTGVGIDQQDIPIFCPFYISVVEESDLDGNNDLQHAQKLLKEYEKREGVAVGDLGRCDDGGEEKYEKTKAKHGDKVFSRFMKRISRCPEQILRYSWNGSPLFINDPPSNMAQMVPVCSQCRSPRTFELQLMPALVNLLQSKKPNSELVPEFGTVIVYTCKSSCWMPGSTLPLEEFIFIQADPDQKLFK